MRNSEPGANLCFCVINCFYYCLNVIISYSHTLYWRWLQMYPPHPQKIVLCIQSFKHAIEPLGTNILYICYIVFKVVRFVGSNLFNRSSEYQYLGKVCIMQNKICLMCSEMRTTFWWKHYHMLQTDCTGVGTVVDKWI